MIYYNNSFIPLTSHADKRFSGLYLTRQFTKPISSLVVKLGKIFSHFSPLEGGNRILL